MNAIVAFLLNLGYQLTHNYGVSMILFAVLLRLVLLPLDFKSRSSTRKMIKLQPELERLSKKYANDRNTLARKQQELYKKENYSPTAGCLPLLIQLPLLFIVFAALRAYSLNTFSLPLINAMESGDMDAITSLFDSTRFLWVQNIFGADALLTDFRQAFPQAATLARLTTGVPQVFFNLKDAVAPTVEGLAGLTANPALVGAQVGAGASAFTVGYDAVRASYQELFSTARLFTHTNGLYLLPLLAGGMQFLQSWLAQRKQPQNPENPQAGSMKTMTYLFPLLSVYLCATYTGLFAVYWIMGSVIAIVLQLATDYYFDRKEAAEKAPQASARVH